MQKKLMTVFATALALCCPLATTAFAASIGDVAGAAERT